MKEVAENPLMSKEMTEYLSLTSELEMVKSQLARAMAIIKIFGDAVDAAKALEPPHET